MKAKDKDRDRDRTRGRDRRCQTHSSFSNFFKFLCPQEEEKMK
jgi:hypothetical protein